MGFWYSNFKAESFKMYLRMLYTIGCWYEIYLMYFEFEYFQCTCYVSEGEWEEKFWERKIHIIGLYVLLIIWNLAEKICFNGTRYVV